MPTEKNGLQALGRGLLLRCPRCNSPHIMQNFFELKLFCPSCHARLERRPGEGTGAMIVLLSLMPFPMILLFILASVLGTSVPLWAWLIGLLVGVTLLILLAYRHARCVWLAVIYLGDGLYSDEEDAARRTPR